MMCITSCALELGVEDSGNHIESDTDIKESISLTDDPSQFSTGTITRRLCCSEQKEFNFFKRTNSIIHRGKRPFDSLKVCSRSKEIKLLPMFQLHQNDCNLSSTKHLRHSTIHGLPDPFNYGPHFFTQLIPDEQYLTHRHSIHITCLMASVSSSDDTEDIIQDEDELSICHSEDEFPNKKKIQQLSAFHRCIPVVSESHRFLNETTQNDLLQPHSCLQPTHQYASQKPIGDSHDSSMPSNKQHVDEPYTTMPKAPRFKPIISGETPSSLKLPPAVSVQPVDFSYDSPINCELQRSFFNWNNDTNSTL